MLDTQQKTFSIKKLSVAVCWKIKNIRRPLPHQKTFVAIKKPSNGFVVLSSGSSSSISSSSSSSSSSMIIIVSSSSCILVVVVVEVVK